MKNSKITLSILLLWPSCSLAQKPTLQVYLNIANRRTAEIIEKIMFPDGKKGEGIQAEYQWSEYR